ncbi:MAG: DsbA family oxidoreductase [Anaerolineae bacterium]|nr:DsbA family oxidoreductase [Anaerolineae bacterium]
MKVEIWSDIACPWCYIGRRRFEKALAQFEHRDEVEITWRSFQLDPNAPRDYAGNVNDLVMQRYGMSREKAESANAQVTELAALEGLEYHMERAHPVNSMDAHRLLHLAAKHHLQGEMKERLQKAYFTDGLVISDHKTLVQLAEEVGLNGDETRRMLESDAYIDAVRTDGQRGQVMGINGVPFFVFDEKYGVSGAQPAETFLTALQRVWMDSHPAW